jgi:hypothetical protein
MTTTDDQARGVLSADGPNQTKALTKMAQLRQQTTQAMQQVAEDRDLLASAKRRKLGELGQAFTSQRDQLRREHQAEVAERRAELHRKAFGPRRPSELDAWRQAAASTATISDEGQAEAAMSAARRAGDEVWARGIAALAAERGWAKVLGRYVEAYPDADAALQEAAQLDSKRRRFEDDMAFSLITPPPVPDHGPAELEAERRARGGGPTLSGRVIDFGR